MNDFCFGKYKSMRVKFPAHSQNSLLCASLYFENFPPTILNWIAYNSLKIQLEWSKQATIYFCLTNQNGSTLFTHINVCYLYLS